jgi:hypothetical protein
MNTRNQIFEKIKGNLQDSVTGNWTARINVGGRRQEIENRIIKVIALMIFDTTSNSLVQL